MGKFAVFLFILLLALRVKAQDERYFRQLYSGELTKLKKNEEEKRYSFFIHTPFYQLDLNHDEKPEEIVYVKKDSEDWVEIFEKRDGERKKILSYKFDTLGYGSELYRIELKKLSEHTSILLLYFYEGMSKYTEMQSTSRIYLLTIDDNNLSTLSVFKGPSLFLEAKSFKGNYHLRNYQAYLQDLNFDGIKEFIVKFHLTSQVFLYKGNGNWKTFNN